MATAILPMEAKPTLSRKGRGAASFLVRGSRCLPDRQLLLNIKSNDPEEGARLAEFLLQLPSERLETLAVYGGDEPIAALKEAIPQLRVMSMATLKRALLSYLAVGWSGYVPAAMRNTQLHIPEKFAPFLWGWSHRFLQRMEAVDTRIILVAGSGKFSEGFDSAEDLARIPKGYSGGIWTNRIDRLAPLVK